MNYKKFLKFSLKKIFLWLGLLFSTGFITYFFSFFAYDTPPVFGFPFPFYCFGGPAMIGGFVPPEFNFPFFIIDAIFWYFASHYIRILKPTKKTIFLWLGLLFSTGFITYFFSFTEEAIFFGFPMTFFFYGTHTKVEVLIPAFIIDAITWYLVSCFIQIMNSKKILRLTLKKAILWLILFLGTGFITYFFSFFAYDTPPVFGFPIPFFFYEGKLEISLFFLLYFDFFNFLFDAILWYLISCFILMYYPKSSHY